MVAAKAVAQPWKPSPDIKTVFGRILKVRPEASQLLADIENAGRNICGIKNSILAVKHRRHRYLVRFVLPVAELAGWPESFQPNLIDWLAVHLQFAALWRAMDNLLDAPNMPDQRPDQLMHVLESSLQASVSLCRFDTGFGRVLRHLSVTARSAIDQRKEAIPFERIWHRAGPFFVVPSYLLTGDRLAVYRSYINLIGLMHDIQDIPRDLELGINTLPTKWLSSLCPNREFRPSALAPFFNFAANELDRRVASLRKKIMNEWAVLSILLQEVDHFRASLSQNYKPQGKQEVL